MNLVLFIFILIVAFIIVRIGAIAFHFTGLDWSLAEFQSLSCFTGTGFTTREAELITGNPQRRRIATVLIILGHAGLVTMIATFANSLGQDIGVVRVLSPSLNEHIPPGLLPWVNLSIIIVVIYLIYKFFTNSRIAGKLTELLKTHLVEKHYARRVSFEELVLATGGYGVTHVEICDDSPVLDKTLRESGLRDQDISVLAVEREGRMLPNPSADTRITLGDKLICFGELKRIRKEFLCAPAPAEKKV